MCFNFNERNGNRLSMTTRARHVGLWEENIFNLSAKAIKPNKKNTILANWGTKMFYGADLMFSTAVIAGQIYIVI